MNQKKLAGKVNCSEEWLSKVLTMKVVGSDDLLERIQAETGITRKILYLGPKEKIKKGILMYMRREKIKALEDGGQR
jgi:transcriptional regulator with XRE-family HTH domain